MVTVALVAGVGIAVGLPFLKKFRIEREGYLKYNPVTGETTLSEEYAGSDSGLVNPNTGDIMSVGEAVQLAENVHDVHERGAIEDSRTKRRIYDSARIAQDRREESTTVIREEEKVVQEAYKEMTLEETSLVWGAMDAKEAEAQEETKVVVPRYQEREEH